MIILKESEKTEVLKLLEQAKKDYQEAIDKRHTIEELDYKSMELGFCFYLIASDFTSITYQYISLKIDEFIKHVLFLEFGSYIFATPLKFHSFKKTDFTEPLEKRIILIDWIIEKTKNP